MARRRSQVADFLTAFNQAYRMTDQVAQDFEIGRIARAKPEEMQGFSQDQAEQLRTAAESGQYDIGVKYKDDGTFDSYTVTPKADGSHTGTIGMQRMTDFLGKRTPGALTDDQVEGMRQKAMAGVVTRSDPVRGMQMMRDITRDERDAKRFEFETHRNDRQVRLDQEVDADKALVKQVDADVADHFRKMLTNPDGTQRAATTDDHLVASQYRASRLLDAGKVDAAGQVIKDFNAQSLVKIQLESAQRNEALGKTAAALAAGDLNAVREFYNQYIPDGARVVDVSQDREGRIVIQRESLDGRPLPATTLKDTGQMLAALSTFKDPMALYNWSQNEFKNNLQLRADARAERADGRAAAADARAAEEAEVKRGREQRIGHVRTQLMQERNPNATPAELEAAHLGVIDPVQRVDDKAPAEVKLARALVDAGIAADMKEGLQQALQTKGKSPEQVRAEIYKAALSANYGDHKRAMEVTDDAMRYLRPAPGGGSGGAGGESGGRSSPARQSGEERVVQSGPHKGKTAVWDGQGWVLKQ